MTERIGKIEFGPYQSDGKVQSEIIGVHVPADCAKRIASLQAQVERLRKYSGHLLGCRQGQPSDVPVDCDCGYAALLAEEGK